jgi:predicted enzyme related to lactoylglutathione lyase
MGALGINFSPRRGGSVGGMMTAPDTPALFWLYHFNVDGIDAAVDASALPAAGRDGSAPGADRPWIAHAPPAGVRASSNR